MAAAADDLDRMCCEFFQMNVEKEQAKKLTPEEKKCGKGTTVRKILKDGLGETSGTISACEASIYPKYQDKKTKKITDEIFVKQILPEVAAMKAKGKVGDAKSEAELAKMKKKLCDQLDKSKNAPAAKNAAVVDRLTDTSKYTGAHKGRFDESGKGKGKDGREDQVDNSGYVGNYKGAGTFDKK